MEPLMKWNHSGKLEAEPENRSRKCLPENPFALFLVSLLGEAIEMLMQFHLWFSSDRNLNFQTLLRLYFHPVNCDCGLHILYTDEVCSPGWDGLVCWPQGSPGTVTKCHVLAMYTTSTTTVLAKLLLTNFISFFTTASSQIVLFLRFRRICIPSVQLEWIVGIGGEQNLGQLFRLPAVFGSRNWKGQSKSNYRLEEFAVSYWHVLKSFKSYFLITMVQWDVVGLVSSNAKP